ncbi:unnamed protein product [Chrysoparadoxa australica]
MLDAVAYFHERNIVHRDLKPENVLLTTEADDAVVKIADFGFAKVCAAGCSDDNTSTTGLTTQCGTPGYVAPEVLRNSAEGYNCAVDVWGMGVITYILLGGYPPFHAEKTPKLFALIKKGRFVFHDKYWSEISAEAKDLISKMLTVDVQQRITAKQALEHPWFSLKPEQAAATKTNLEMLKSFQARRKLRTAIREVMAIRCLAGNMLPTPQPAMEEQVAGSKEGKGGTHKKEQTALLRREAKVNSKAEHLPNYPLSPPSLAEGAPASLSEQLWEGNQV